jgi:signal transduction histidine kinase
VNGKSYALPGSNSRRVMLMLALIVFALKFDSALGAERMSLYMYEDTRRLVALVEAAALLVEQKGDGAFAQFNTPGSKWWIDQYYIFVYGLDGTCLFHPIQPELIGQNLMALKDMSGRPVVQFITEIGRKAEKDAGGWVFYLWPDRAHLIPLWKSAYIRKVSGPSGKTYLVGSGIYNIKTEKFFIEERVRAAAELLQVKGKDAAFQEFRNPASPFVFLDNYIFVLDMQGRAVVDPAYPTLQGRDLSGFRDAVGLATIKEMIRKLQNGDQAWVQYLWPKPGAALAARKLMYGRKVKAGEENFIVGSDFFLATPVWMRG